MFDTAAFAPDLFAASSSSCAFDGGAFDDGAFDVCGTPAASEGHPTYRRMRPRLVPPPEPLREDEELLWII